MAERSSDPHIWVSIALYPPNFSGAAIQVDRVLPRMALQGFKATVLTSGDLAALELRGRSVDRGYATVNYLPAVPVRSGRRGDGRGQGLLRRVTRHMVIRMRSLSLNALRAKVLWQSGRRDDIVAFQSLDTFSFLPLQVARLKGMHPVVHLNLLGSDDPAFIVQRLRRGRLLEALRLASFRRVEAVVSISTGLTRSCLDSGIPREKVLQIPHGVDVDEFLPASQPEKVELRGRLGLDAERSYVVFVGACIARKGIDVLVRAYVRARRQAGDVGLLVVGPYDFDQGVFRNPALAQARVESLRDELEAAGCSSEVHWIGRVDNVRDYMRAADLFCLPTRREGFGIAIIEAMACGLPVVVARLEGVTTDIVQSDGHGLLIERGDPEDYADAILRILQDPALAERMGRAARERAVKHFSLNRVVDRYARLYRELADVRHA